jgi:hypothetical protein
MDYRYVYISLRFIENWLKNLQDSISTLDPSRLNIYRLERDEFSSFMEMIEKEIEIFDGCKGNIREFEHFVYVKVVISDVYFYLDMIIKEVLDLFRKHESSFSPVYDIIIKTRQSLNLIIETIEDPDKIYEYDVEEKTVFTLKLIEKQFSILYNNRMSFDLHPILGQFRSMNLCMLNFLRR